MTGPTTISEALETLPSSQTSFTAVPTPRRTSTGRRLLVKSNKFTPSAPAEEYRPAKLQWVPQNTTHILPGHGSSTTRNGKVKEAILIAGRDSSVKQSLRFHCGLPLPFLEQNGPHDEDLLMDIDNDPTMGQANGGGLTASDLEMDLKPDGNGSEEGAGMSADFLEDIDAEMSSPSKPKHTSHTSKRRRMNPNHTDQDEGQDSLPLDFLALLKLEIPQGGQAVSPGDFARVWRLSGRELGNEMVLAQNEYFGNIEKSGGKNSSRRKAKGKGL